MTFTMIPMFGSLAFAAEADHATVYMTVSFKGELAKANDGSPMAWKEVTVTDINEDGEYSYHEALTAAHAAYNSADGYGAATSTYGAYVTKLWGVETSNTLFFLNDVPIKNDVETDKVADGDYLLASVNADDAYYSDYFTTFGSTGITVTTGADVAVTLSGYMGMGLDPTATPVKGAALGYFKEDGTFVDLSKVTDAEGKATISFSEPGTYYLTASGSVPDSLVTNWNIYSLASGGGAPFGWIDYDTYDSYVAYTEKDYGEGPYPADEVKYMDFYDWKDLDEEELETVHALASNQFITTSPTIAPCMTVVVKAPVDFVLDEIGKLSNDPRDFTAADKEKVEAVQAAYEALNAEDQAKVDSTFNHPSGDGQSYGRVLEAAVWAVRSYDTDTKTTLADGTYTTMTSMSDKGKSDSSRVRNWWVESVVVENGQATAYIYVNSKTTPDGSKLTSYPSIWAGGKSIERDADNNYAIPVDLNGTTYFGGVSSSMPRPIMYALEVEIAEPVVIPEANITNNTGMFKAVSASYMMNEDGSATLTFALSGTGYKELFKGTYEQAVANGDGTADKGNDSWIHGYTNAAGKLEFQIPIKADEIGTVVPLVAVSNSYYTNYLNDKNVLARAFYPRQLQLDTDEATLVTGDFESSKKIAVTNNVSMFRPAAEATLETVGGPNSNNYKAELVLPMTTASMDAVFVGVPAEAEAAEKTIAFDSETSTFTIPVKWVETFGQPETLVTLCDGKPFVLSFHSASNGKWYGRTATLDEEAGTLVFDPWIDPAPAQSVDEMIAKIQSQVFTETTYADCEAAKAAWDALSDAEKALVEEYDYFGLDTGDASKDDPLNQDEIGKNEILVVSFGTSFNDSRVATIGGVEKAIAEAYPDWSVRRAFTAQIIINHVYARDGEKIDNVQQALERAVANNVETLIVQPTHLMHGAEYDELVEALEPYQDKITIIVAEPLLGEVGADATIINDDKMAVAEAIVAAACKDAGYTDAAAAAADGAAIVLMGHGTEHVANITYEQMQTAMNKLGYANVFIGTVEGLPESTECSNVIAAVKAAGYKKVFLRPLMVVAGDHANNDMADPEDEESWVSQFTADGSFTSITAQIAGLGEIPAVQQIYVSHVTAVMVEKIADDIEDLPAADDITLDDYEDIMAVKDAFDALSDEDKAKIDPDAVKDLKLAAATVENLKAQEDIAELEEQIAALKEQLAKTPGWHTNDDGSKYYNDANGEKVKGWLSDGGKWYFMDKETGIMQTGWVKDGKWYFMDKETGIMATGWVKDGETWYYMNTSGAMQTGWLKDGNTWYYLKSSGAMAASEWCEGYWLNANGSWTYQPKGSWKQNSTGWWFGDTSGWYAKSTTQKIDGVEYTFNAAGYWVQ